VRAACGEKGRPLGDLQENNGLEGPAEEELPLTRGRWSEGLAPKRHVQHKGKDRCRKKKPWLGRGGEPATSIRVQGPGICPENHAGAAEKTKTETTQLENNHSRGGVTANEGKMLLQVKKQTPCQSNQESIALWNGPRAKRGTPYAAGRLMTVIKKGKASGHRKKKTETLRGPGTEVRGLPRRGGMHI